MKHLKTAALLLAPPLLMGSFALYLSRKSGDKAATVVRGPFSIKVAGAENISVTPLDVYEGYHRHFEIVFDAQGKRPAWWGKKISSRSGTRPKNWKFFLEREGKITPFEPSKSTAWTSKWNEDKQRYVNDLFLQSGDVPTQSALKVRGVTGMDDFRTKLSAPLPFEITLKKAGENWMKPVVSTAPGLVVRKITVKRVGISDREATILVFNPTGEYGGDWQSGGDFLDGKWRPLDHIETAEGALKGYHVQIQHTFGGGNPPLVTGRAVPHSENLREYQFSWKVADMKGEPQRDVIAVAHVSTADRWPLEIAFYAKKNGQQALGVVPALTRPR